MKIRRHVLGCATLLSALVAMPTGAQPSPCAGKPVKINSRIYIDGKAHAGIPVKVGTESEIIADSFSDDWTGARGVTDAAGGLSLSTCYTGINVRRIGLIFRFRTDWNGDRQIVLADAAPDGSFKYSGNVDFTGPGAKDFQPVRPDSKIKFRFPINDPLLINNFDFLPGIAKNAADLFLSGPLGLDHKAPKGSPGSPGCTNYAGRGGDFLGVPFCYGSHEGTDYMLLGGFAQMDQSNTNLVVAAADGIVEEIHEGQFDRCHACGIGCISCGWLRYGVPRPMVPNKVVIRHNLNPGDPVIRTEYLHIKAYSAGPRIKKGQFVPCGTVIAEIGSSGRSAAPHLHFNVLHENTYADPYQGKLSTRTYWVNQTGGVRGFPSTQCQSALDRYGPNHGAFSAAVTVAPPEDLGIRTSSPVEIEPGSAGLPTRYWAIKARVASSSLKGFNAELTTVKFTLPATAQYFGAMPSKVDEDALFFIPIASARDPALSQYAFDVRAEVSQTNGLATPLTRHVFAHVKIPRPQVSLVASGFAVGRSKTCATNRVYSVKLSASATGLSGPPVTSWLTTTTAGKRMTSAPTPLTLCGGEGASTTVTIADAKGVESVSQTKSFTTPTFVAPIWGGPAPKSPVNTIPIPNGSVLQSAGDKSVKVYGEMRFWVKPQEVGGSFPTLALDKLRSIAWKDLSYRDRADGIWKPIPRGVASPTRAGRRFFFAERTSAQARMQNVSYRMDKTLYDGDTIVLAFTDLSWATQFRAWVTVTDAGGRVAVDAIEASNGVFPDPQLKEGIKNRVRFRDLFFAAGFHLDGKYRPEPMALAHPRPVVLPAPDGFAELVRKQSLLNRRDRVAVARFHTELTAFTRKLERVRTTKVPFAMSARSWPKLTVQPTRWMDTPMMKKLVEMNAAPRAAPRSRVPVSPKLLERRPAQIRPAVVPRKREVVRP